MPLLTAKQFDDWLEDYNDNPWGPLRDDLRMEVLRQRILQGIFGDQESLDDMPGPIWPYKSANDCKDWGAIIEAQDKLLAELVDDGSGTGRMKWRDA